MASQLKTDRLILRPLVAEDSTRVVEMLGDFRVAQWTASIPHPFGLSDLRILTSDGETRWPNMMGVELDGRLIGSVSMSKEFGYYFAPEVWGQGIATEAARAKIADVFATTDLAEITAGVFQYNPASQRVLEKLGFQPTGTSRKHCTSQGADLVSLEMTLTRIHWETLT